MNPKVSDPLSLLHQFRHNLQEADSIDGARLAAINGLNRLVHFDQSVLWIGKSTPVAASSIDTPDPKAPHTQQLASFFNQKLRQQTDILLMGPSDLAQIDLYAEHHGVFVPLKIQDGGLLLVRPGQAFTSAQAIILDFALRIATPEILKTSHARLKKRRSRKLSTFSRSLAAVALVSALGWLCSKIPVPQTMMVSAEIVSGDIHHVRVPIDGVVDEVLVLSGSTVTETQELAILDTQQIIAQLEIATAEFERLSEQFEQETILSLTSETDRIRTAELSGLLSEKLEQVRFLQTQLERHTIRAGQSGMVIMPDVESLRGTPVVTGETLMEIANPEIIEVDLWIPLATSLPIEPNDVAAIFLATNPTESHPARIVYTTPRAQRREDGTMGYRGRATFETSVPTNLLGQQGMARIHLGETNLLMLILRQPLMWIRQVVRM